MFIGYVRQYHKEYNVQNYSKYDRMAHKIVFINERHIQIGLSFLTKMYGLCQKLAISVGHIPRTKSNSFCPDFESLYLHFESFYRRMCIVDNSIIMLLLKKISAPNLKIQLDNIT